MDASAADNNPGSMRERELEVEIARLNAEIAVLKGGAEPAEVAARFLTMAASTVDAAMLDARKEADELAIEVTAAAEARRDEATRVAQEVEAQTEALRIEANTQEQVAEAARHDARTQQEAAEAARHEAQRVTNAATQHINKERARVAEEVERLADVRSALETERSALETYHEELKRRVQELAESMVAFMTTEPPLAAVTAIEDLASPAITPAAAAVEAAYTPDSADDDDADDFETDGDVEAEGPADTDVVTSIPEPVPPATPIAEVAMAPDQPVAVPDETATVLDESAEIPAEIDEPTFEFATGDLEEPVAENSAVEPVLEEPVGESVDEAESFEETEDPVVQSLPTNDLDPAIAAIFETPEPRLPADANEALFGRSTPAPAVAQPPASTEPGTFSRIPTSSARPSPAPSFTDMMSGATEEPTNGEFGGVPVTEASADEPRGRRMGGLFSRNRGVDNEESIESVLGDGPPSDEGGLFGSQASRLFEQTSPERLASALEDEGEEDERFRSFLDGDGDSDPSRDWLLRPDQED